MVRILGGGGTEFCLKLYLSRTEFCLGLHTAVVFRMQSSNCIVLLVYHHFERRHDIYTQTTPGTEELNRTDIEYMHTITLMVIFNHHALLHPT